MLSCSVVSNSFWSHGLRPARLFCPWGFSRQEYWSSLPSPTPRDIPSPRNQTQASRIAGRFFTIWATREAREYWSGLGSPTWRCNRNLKCNMSKPNLYYLPQTCFSCCVPHLNKWQYRSLNFSGQKFWFLTPWFLLHSTYKYLVFIDL